VPFGRRCSHLHHVISGLLLSWLLCFLTLIWRTLHVVSVSVGNADEVGVGNAKGSGLGKDDEKVEFLRHLAIGISLWVTLSSENSVVFVNENIVAHDPYGDQSGRNDSEHAGGEKFTSAGSGIFSEEYYKEARSNAQWGKEYEDNNWEVPVDIIIEDQEKVHSDHVDGEKYGECSNSNDSTFDWEASAA